MAPDLSMFEHSCLQNPKWIIIHLDFIQDLKAGIVTFYGVKTFCLGFWAQRPHVTVDQFAREPGPCHSHCQLLSVGLSAVVWL